jgi:hypothetical protein
MLSIPFETAEEHLLSIPTAEERECLHEFSVEYRFKKRGCFSTGDHTVFTN